MTAFSQPLHRAQKIKSFGHGYNKLMELLGKVPAGALDFRTRRDLWTINEMLMHLADLEAAAYLNFRKAIAEPTETITVFDKDLWAESLEYYGKDPAASLKLFRLLRMSNYLLLKNISQDIWLHTVNYPDNGQITLEDLLDQYEEHFNRVMMEIEHNWNTWMKQA